MISVSTPAARARAMIALGLAPSERLRYQIHIERPRMGKLDAVKTDFVTIASHELRTPLAQLRGYTDIMDALNEQGMLDTEKTSGMIDNISVRLAK